LVKEFCDSHGQSWNGSLLCHGLVFCMIINK
jgi:hypothetical protein